MRIKSAVSSAGRGSKTDKSLLRDTSPPFVPIALLDQETAHDPITNVRNGSYWNLIIGYTIASGIFPPGSQEETWIPRYQEQHGGICMGMIRLTSQN